MIPKASQRSGGQDLATHLLNALDNEYVEVAEVSGAIAADLHGAFAEWEAIASSLTRCKNYLYSLSVNPDLGQGELTRAQYLDYVDRVEKRLGLEGQPRALVFHSKEGRAHCHVVWSRVDFFAEKAIHMPFDHEKLMMVTREFARDHGLTLPDGYHRDQGDERRRPLSLYEKQQERATGLSKEDRVLMVTHAWKQSDSPRAFVRALEGMGYVLATGNRPYVLVDMYGTMNALPKMIDDRSVRTKDIRAFLERAYPPESLPTVDEARALVAEHRKAQEQFAKAQDDGRRLDALKAVQAQRRAELEGEREGLRERQRAERAALERSQLAARRELQGAYLARVRQVKAARAEAKPRGLAAFLGRVTGVSLILGKLHRHRDARAYDAFVEQKAVLMEAQRGVALLQQREHELHALEMDRQLKALARVDVREQRSLEETRVREQRIRQRAGHDHMPALALALKPRGRGASVRKAAGRYRDSLRGQEDRQPRRVGRAADRDIDLNEAMTRALAAQTPISSPVDVSGAFARAAGGETSGTGSGGGDEGGAAAKPVSRASRRGERERESKRGDDFERER